MEIQYVYSKKRSEFGRYTQFSDDQPKLIDNIMPNSQLQDDYILMDPVHRPAQCSTQFAVHSVILNLTPSLYVKLC